MTILLLISVLVCSDCRNWTGYKGVVLLKIQCIHPAGKHAEFFKVPAQVPRYLCKVLLSRHMAHHSTFPGDRCTTSRGF